MERYKLNFASNTITITRAFAIKANHPDSDEYTFLTKVKKDFPGIDIIHKYHRSSCGNGDKGLTYANMERYIKTFDNADELMGVFNLVKEYSCIQDNRWLYVKKWFIAQFPDYKEIPAFDGLRIVAPMIPIKPDPDLPKAG